MIPVAGLLPEPIIHHERRSYLIIIPLSLQLADKLFSSVRIVIPFGR